MESWRERKPAEFRKLTAAIAALAAASGCGEDDEPAERPSTTGPPSAKENGQKKGPELKRVAGRGRAAEYVGKVTGKPDIYAAVTTMRPVDGDEPNAAAVYFCDGKDVAEMMVGLLRDEDRFTAFSRKGGDVTLSRRGGKYVGTGTLADGTRVTFVASPVERGGPAGFYFAASKEDPSFRGADYGGWIVLPDGSQRGAITRAGTPGPGGTLNTRTGVVRTGSRTISPIEPFNAEDGTCGG